MSGGSKSKTSSATTYSNTDKRVVADGGSLGLSADNLLGTGNLQVQGNKNRLGFSDASTSATAGAWLAQGDRNNITSYALDGGAIKASADVIRAGLATVEKGDATNGEGFSRLLELAGDLFEGAGEKIDKAQSLASQAFTRAADLQDGSIDNRTIAILGVAAAGAVAVWAWGKK